MLNNVSLMGRIGCDLELKETSSGIPVVSFRIAVVRTFNREKTDWISIVAWRQQAEFIAKYFRKGSLIVLDGSIQTDQFEDTHGQKRTSFSVVVNQVFFAEDKKSSQENNQNKKIQLTDFDDITDDECTDFPF